MLSKKVTNSFKLNNSNATDDYIGHGFCILSSLKENFACLYDMFLC
jgi:hypothetical protein